MLYVNFYTDISMYMFLYMFLYNLTLINLFWIFFAIINREFKTLYSFSFFGFDSFYLFCITIFLFSLAGVPPFIGFFSKLFLLNILINKNFYLLYYLLFPILLLGLYFYVQNIRFLHSSNLSSSTKIYVGGQERLSYVFLYFLVFVSFITINGVLYLDDFLLFFLWIFS